MNIAFLGTRGIPGRYGAFETFGEQVGPRLVEQGFEISVYCPHDHPYKKRTYKGVKRVPVFNYEQSFGSFGTIFYDIASLIKASFSKHDVIYMLGYPSSIFCWLPRLCGKKVVINTDGIEWKRQKWGRLAKIYLRFSEWMATKVGHHLITDAETLQRYYWNKYKRKTHFLAYGADIADSQTPSLLKNYTVKPRDYYLILARLEPENSIHTILEGFKNSKSKKTLLVVGNTPDDNAYVQKLINTYQSDRIRFLGGIYDDDIKRELRTNAFGYFHGHTVGGINPSLLEAAGCGCTVIARNTPFNKEVLNKHGLYFDTAADFASHVDAFEKTKNLRKRKKAMQDIVRKRFTWEILTQQYADFFNSLK